MVGAQHTLARATEKATEKATEIATQRAIRALRPSFEKFHNMLDAEQQRTLDSFGHR